MGDCNKVKYMCGEKTYATCVYYELDIPEFSELSEEDCVTVEETVQDIYSTLEEIKNDIDLSALGESCLDYVTGQERNTVKTVLLAYETEICALKEKVRVLEEEAICDKDITQCLDLGALEDQCSNPISNLGQLLQYLLTQVQA